MTRVDNRIALRRAAVVMLAGASMWLHSGARAGQASLGWDFTSTGAAGFVLNCGTSSGNYTSRIDVGSNKSFTMTGLTEGTKYYCVVAAYDAAKVEGVPSTELVVPIPYAKPVVNFTGSPVNATAPASVTFSNSTKGEVTTWLWSFGDGATSAGQNPTHVYSNAGSYTVTLTATGPGGTASVSGVAIQVAAATKPGGSTPGGSTSGGSTPTTPSGTTSGGSTTGGSTTGSSNSGGSTSGGSTAGGSTSGPGPKPVPPPKPPSAGTGSPGSGTGGTTSLPPSQPSPQPRPAPSRNGLVAAYGFDEGQGETVADASGKGNAGVIMNAAWAAGRFGKALKFSGDGWVTVSDSASLDLTTGMTLEAWVYPTAQMHDWRDVIMKQNSWSDDAKQGVSYYLCASSQWGPPVGGVTIGSERMVRGKAALISGRWFHLATTYDGSTQRVYVDGVLVASRAQSGRIRTGSGPLRIGGDGLWGEHFRGLIDEVRVYKRALTIDEIRSDMNTPVNR